MNYFASAVSIAMSANVNQKPAATFLPLKKNEIARGKNMYLALPKGGGPLGGYISTTSCLFRDGRVF
ncbi:hypothetical protein [Sulfitobacter sp. W074]|uniref:hypothetical protein n=1 Tax=Sulfitobacter sp. W074 TaxID=2867026 RepID=UPI0021A8AFB9|nr:hypothetical protein [Sulfitobacter sp. W074]UWR38424.1 hypothetical protein K3762_05160 [Sulfitobacter sp. W074]